MTTSTADILTPTDPLTGSVTYGTSSSTSPTPVSLPSGSNAPATSTQSLGSGNSQLVPTGNQPASNNPLTSSSSSNSSPISTSSGSLPSTFGASANLYSGSTWSSSTNNNSFAGAENNPFAGGGGYAYASLGNTVVGNNQWIIGKETTPERFSRVINYTTEEVVDSVIVKLSNRLAESGITASPTGGNPFAGGNNPFGSTNAPALDFLRQVYGVNFPIPQSASNFLTSVYGQTLPGGSSNPFPSTGAGTSGTGGSNSLGGAGTSGTGGSNPLGGAGTSGAGSNPFAGAGTSGGSNPFAGAGSSSGGGIPSTGAPIPGTTGGNPLIPSGNSTTGGSIPQQASFDITQVIFGGSLPSGGSGRSSSETLRVVQDGLLNFTKTVNSAVGKRLFSGNNTPLKSPSDLLTLFKNDILSANTSINTVNDLAGGGTDPYQNLAGGSGSQAVQPSNDILYTVLGGLLPFSGTDNIFSTPDGSIPIGYGNKNFGTDSAVIGNSNWNYGTSNASIGNANWNWDFTKNNATIGNGNWHLDYSKNNRTLGNGNWYWESTADNNTLGNGNWHFGNNNTTIGNGNWDFGSNNTIIGNGNWVFTSNSIVIGNGNWSVIIDKSSTAAGDFLGKLDNLVLSMGIKDGADNLVNSLIGKFGGAFEPLTGELTAGGRKTYDQLFYSDNSSAIAAAPSP